MSSTIDVPLDNLVQSSRGGMRGRGRGRGRGGFGRGGTASLRGRGGAKRGGGAVGIKARLGYNTDNFTPQNGEAVSDLRDVLAIKTKTDVKDLRAKLPPKALTTKGGKAASGGSTGKGATAASRGQTTTKRGKMTTTTSSSRSSSSSMLKAALATHTSSSRSSGSSGGGILRSDRTTTTTTTTTSARKPVKESTRRLPTTAEAKKITVTVQGMAKTTNESYRKEERLAATILRQKETRQQSYMKSREESIASTITSALNMDRDGMHGGRSQAYQRYQPSPPPPPQPSQMEYRYENQMMSNQMPINTASRQRGITTVTTLVISNLNDTVSHNDIAELCTAIGPVENVIMTAPGCVEVTFRYKDDALEAFRKYNQRNLDGMPMVCRVQPGGPSRRPPSAPSYNGGRNPYQPEPMYSTRGGFY